jgi:uncharacterized short protein YbdD (DUF466 family)
MTAREMATQTRTRVDRVAAVIRRIIGVPDYDRYVAHIAEHHPGCMPMTREDFTNQRMYEKYSKPGARCC